MPCTAESHCAAHPLLPFPSTNAHSIHQCVQALTELYQLLDKLGEQLGLARNELFVANLGGHPLLLPGALLLLWDGVGLGGG